MPNPSEKVSEGEGVAACEHGIRHPWACDECERRDLERLHAAAPYLAEALLNLLSECADDFATEEMLIAAGRPATFAKAVTLSRAALSRLTPKE